MRGRRIHSGCKPENRTNHRPINERVREKLIRSLQWDPRGLAMASKDPKGEDALNVLVGKVPEHNPDWIRPVIRPMAEEIISAAVAEVATQLKLRIGTWGSCLPECASYGLGSIPFGLAVTVGNSLAPELRQLFGDSVALIRAYYLGEGLPSFQKWRNELELRNERGEFRVAVPVDDSYPSCCDWTGGSD